MGDCSRTVPSDTTTLYFFQHASFSDLCQRALFSLAILFTALLLPEFFYFSRTTRFTTFVAIVACSATSFREHEIFSQIVSYLLGFSVTWTILWSADLLLFKNPPRDFKKVRRVQVGEDGIPQYEWEPFPEHLSIRRVFWVLDLLGNPRAIGWSHSKKFNNPPKAVLRLYEGQERLTNTIKQREMSDSRSIVRQNLNKSIVPTTRVEFLLNHMGLFILDWLLVEVATHGMTLDAFLNGSGDLNPFVLSLPDAVSWFRLLPYRMAVAAVGCYSIIDLFFVTVSLIGVGLGEPLLGTWGETWMYPRHWGSILDLYYRGIAGFWGSFWHDLFTYGFITFAHSLIPTTRSSNPLFNNRTRRFLRLNIIFALSGFMHMAGSYLQSEPTFPFLTFLTFYLQGVGICLQGLLIEYLERQKVKEEASRAVVFFFAAIWGSATMPLLLKDLAAGGIFRTKFLPFSLTGLVLGNKWPGWFA